MSDLTSLLERVEKADGPDRELDAAIMFDLFAVPVGQKDDGGPSGYLWPEDNPSWSFGIRFPGKDREWFKTARAKNDGETLLIERDGALVLMNQMRIPKLSASLDAALALVQEKLPGWTRAVDATAPDLGIDVSLFSPGTQEAQGTHNLETHATLIALLRALIAQAKEQAHG